MSFSLNSILVLAQYTKKSSYPLWSNSGYNFLCKVVLEAWKVTQEPHLRPMALAMQCCLLPSLHSLSVGHLDMNQNRTSLLARHVGKCCNDCQAGFVITTLTGIDPIAILVPVTQ